MHLCVCVCRQGAFTLSLHYKPAPPNPWLLKWHMSVSETKVRDARRRRGGVTRFPFPVDTLCHHQPSAVAVLCESRQRHHSAALKNQIKVNTEYFNIFASEYVIIMNRYFQQLWCYILPLFIIYMFSVVFKGAFHGLYTSGSVYLSWGVLLGFWKYIYFLWLFWSFLESEKQHLMIFSGVSWRL